MVSEDKLWKVSKHCVDMKWRDISKNISKISRDENISKPSVYRALEELKKRCKQQNVLIKRPSQHSVYFLCIELIYTNYLKVTGMPNAVELCMNSSLWDNQINPKSRNPYSKTERLAICTWSYKQGKLTSGGVLSDKTDILNEFSKNPGWFFSELQKLRKQTQYTLGDILKNNVRQSRQKVCVTQSKKPIKERLREKYISLIRHTPLYQTWLLNQIQKD